VHGLSLESLAEHLDGLIVTCGAEGSIVYAGGNKQSVACVPASTLADPTGCGDAFRGGLLYGLSQGWTLVQATQLGSVMGACKIEHRGAQNYAPTRHEIAERYAACYGSQPW
jgi:adenosine kinase